MTAEAIELELGRPLGSLSWFQKKIRLPNGLPNFSSIASAVIFVALSGPPRSGRQASVPQSSVLTKCYRSRLRFSNRKEEETEGPRRLFLLTEAHTRGPQK
jgi:hypothetical protein